METDARHAFLTRLIDDAGLFPPASLPMTEAARSHREHRGGTEGWVLGRFLCPASRLEELLPEIPEQDAADPWRVSVILDGTGGGFARAVAEDLTSVGRFAKEATGRAVVELVEARLPPTQPERAVSELVDAVRAAGLPSTVAPFAELPPSAEIRGVIEAIASARGDRAADDLCGPPGAKLRCGGPTPDLVPSPARVAEFVEACRDLEVPFKATAGLHHPFRHVDGATGHEQHGFVNLVGAAIVALTDGAEATTLEAIVADRDPGAFALDAQGFRWHDHHSGPAAIDAARATLFTAYGSCSFEEPVEDLRALGVLPA